MIARHLEILYGIGRLLLTKVYDEQSGVVALFSLPIRRLLEVKSLVSSMIALERLAAYIVCLPFGAVYALALSVEQVELGDGSRLAIMSTPHFDGEIAALARPVKRYGLIVRALS